MLFHKWYHTIYLQYIKPWQYYCPTSGGFIKAGLLYSRLDYYDGKLIKPPIQKHKFSKSSTNIHTYMGLNHIPKCAFWFQLKEDFYFTMLDALLYLNGTKQISQKIFLLPWCLHFLKYLNCKSHKSYLSYDKLLHVPKHTNAYGLNLTNTLSN
jgi:hypothetical protein